MNRYNDVKKGVRKKIKQDTKKFLANGNKISTIEIGVSHANHTRSVEYVDFEELDIIAEIKNGA